ncbi:hypothetical protein [Shewanella subflava]|uniref:DNA polymerase III subunit beta n=1 Tax=Shewanella subflava TaxID=2986476 RepID=A0ABT3IBS8_9GAMM|nr:hypothetical protein [Shewanella subflava]MCW3173502.1 hypothetical protein [Shewanella subflava]
MPKLIFKPEHRQPMNDLLEKVSKSDAEARISFIINDETCKIINGSGDDIQIISLYLEKSWRLKKGEWSLSASSFKQCWCHLHEYTSQKEDFEIVIEYDSKKTFPYVDTLINGESRIYIYAQEVVTEHLDFLVLSEQAKQHIVSTTSIKSIIKAAETHTPFDAFEINKAQSKIRIERDNEIIPYALPQTLIPEFDLLLNKESLENLSRLCDSTRSDTLSIYTDDERAIFSDGNRVVSSSLLSLRDYAHKKETSYTVEQKLVINTYTLKDEIESYRNMAIVKKANEALLYIDNTNVMLAGLTKETGGNRFLSAEHISQTQPAVYRINLSALAKVKVKDVTTANQIKVQLLLGQDGKRKLGFYNDKDSTHPYESVYDIELAPEKMAEVLEAKKALESKMKNNRGGRELQGDMLGFDDI